ncbi:phosphodiesterase [Salinibacterium sp. dk2585]|uniref:phosphodiesterase n=1 Tax=unclassified Salinibacterium TaxID=2632331 RepID=UPI0011C24F31|nr:MULTISPECIES: phosphodiesterase [unclassified Salinibacterium]QEE62149.1 phosphodiesterase [Salinibacterium sp. dk2585]TXK53501.1 phosphodiesterase [Salinibacterium sp. dk5596]
MSGYTAAHRRPDHFVLHLSDTHLLAGGKRLYDRVDSEARLAELFARLEASGARPEAIVLTGDLADHGEPEAYAKLRAIVEPAAERLGAQVVWVMGNHDDRGAFREQLLDQHPSTRPVDRVHDINGLRIITLDSTVPGHHHGEVSDEQLDWLAEELASPAPHGTILAMHHPPVPSVQDLAVLVELRDRGPLAEVVRGSDIRSIIAGHLHYSTTATFAGIPVSVASATCYTQDLAGEFGSTMPRDGAQSYNLIHVYDDTVMHTVVPVAASSTLSYTSTDETAQILARHGVSILPPANAPVPAEPPLTTGVLDLMPVG